MGEIRTNNQGENEEQQQQVTSPLTAIALEAPKRTTEDLKLSLLTNAPSPTFIESSLYTNDPIITTQGSSTTISSTSPPNTPRVPLTSSNVLPLAYNHHYLSIQPNLPSNHQYSKHYSSPTMCKPYYSLEDKSRTIVKQPSSAPTLPTPLSCHDQAGREFYTPISLPMPPTIAAFNHSDLYDSSIWGNSCSLDVLVKGADQKENFKVESSLNDKSCLIPRSTLLGKYTCTTSGCGKAFPSRSRLRRHVLVHSRVKSFSCLYDGCNRCFSRRDNMLQHYRIHTVTIESTKTIPTISDPDPHPRPDQSSPDPSQIEQQRAMAMDNDHSPSSQNTFKGKRTRLS